MIDRTLNRVKLKPSYINNSMKSIQNMIINNNPNRIKYLSKFSKFLRLLLENSRRITVLISNEIITLKHLLEIHQIEKMKELFYTFSKKIKYSF
ncbi:histidine kinase [Tenacibaculum sp. ZS6-P6]|uniref:histidine kinase n=1 Tax=Tenacibaculum sp. ZS6-P6 TaxID=3447503 RepID=UPI003F9D282B